MSGITKTIPQKGGVAALAALYDGRAGEMNFIWPANPPA